jgi:hypothetical protein
VLASSDEFVLFSNLPYLPQFPFSVFCLKLEEMHTATVVRDYSQVLGIKDAVVFNKVAVYIVAFHGYRPCPEVRLPRVGFHRVKLPTR